MPIENDSKENDIVPPKPAMTYAQYIRLVQRREEIQHAKYLKLFAEIQEDLEKLQRRQEETQRYREETQRIREETQKYREQTQTEFNNRMDALIKDAESHLSKRTEQPEPSLVKDNEHGSEMRQLKAQVAELKEENEELKNTIHQLWELLTSFCRSKATSVAKGFNSFFSKGKTPASLDPTTQVENNSSTNSF